MRNGQDLPTRPVERQKSAYQSVLEELGQGIRSLGCKQEVASHGAKRQGGRHRYLWRNWIGQRPVGKGTVIEVVPGPDGVVQSAKVKTATGVLSSAPARYKWKTPCS